MIRSDAQRTMLFVMDAAIFNLRQKIGDNDPSVLRLTGQ
jgi:predicted 2-oxoglutarate/Fe(II)-dependent dioxygenase YbiX